MAFSNTAESQLQSVLETLGRRLDKIETAMCHGKGVSDRGHSDRPKDRELAISLLGNEGPVSSDRGPISIEKTLQDLGALSRPRPTPTSGNALPKVASQGAAEPGTKASAEEIQAKIHQAIEAGELNGGGEFNPVTPGVVERIASIAGRVEQGAADSAFLVSLCSQLIAENQSLRAKVNTFISTFIADGLRKNSSLRR